MFHEGDADTNGCAYCAPCAVCAPWLSCYSGISWEGAVGIGTNNFLHSNNRSTMISLAAWGFVNVDDTENSSGLIVFVLNF